MAKTIIVERMALASLPSDGMRPTPAQQRLAAERMGQEIEERVKRREAGLSTPEDDIEVIIEWV